MSAAISPLEQLEQQSAQAQPSPQAAPASNLSPLEQLEQMSAKATQPTTPSGQVTNDVGQQVVVPKDDESFTDTVNRAKALQKQREGSGTQQSAIDAETATIPKKTAQTLAGAATIGAVGPAVMALPGEAAGLAKNYILKQLAEQTPELFGHEAVKETLKRYALDGVKKAMTGAAWAGGAETLHSIWNDVFGHGKR